MPSTALIPEHDRAVLVRDLPAVGLKAGDIGVVVHVHRPDKSGAVAGYALEIFAASGATLDVVDVPADAVRPIAASDRLAVRTLVAE